MLYIKIGLCYLIVKQMIDGLEKLGGKEYPGRIILLGLDKTGTQGVVVYGITGRSPSSQARKIECTGNRFMVKPTQEDILNEGNVDLLIYPSILIDQGLAVSNGKQTEDILKSLTGAEDAVAVLEQALSSWEYEPDEPAFTPRISGCLLKNGRSALSVIRRKKQGGAQRNYWEIPLEPGKGKLISTYSGVNENPLPSFEGIPEDIELVEDSAEDQAEAVYAALGPQKHSTHDFRVSVVCIHIDLKFSGGFFYSIINRSERGD